MQSTDEAPTSPREPKALAPRGGDSGGLDGSFSQNGTNTCLELRNVWYGSVLLWRDTVCCASYSLGALSVEVLYC